jgi:hypothetical protein
MPFNTDDTKKAPFTGECMTLTNEEVVKVQDECEIVAEGFEPDDFKPVVNDSYIIARYNESNDYKEAINGATYDVVKYYDREYNTQGITANEEGLGYIIPEPVIEEPEEAPVEEEQAPEGETIPEEETPVVDETEAPAEDVQPTEEEVVEEAPVEEAAPTEEV